MHSIFDVLTIIIMVTSRNRLKIKNIYMYIWGPGRLGRRSVESRGGEVGGSGVGVGLRRWVGERVGGMEGAWGVLG